jgi:hypothetical protein
MSTNNHSIWKARYGYSREKINHGAFVTVLQGIITAAKEALEFARQSTYPARKEAATIISTAECMIEPFQQKHPLRENADEGGDFGNARFSTFLFALLFISARKCSKAEFIAQINECREKPDGLEEKVCVLSPGGPEQHNPRWNGRDLSAARRLNSGARSRPSG